MQLDHYLSFLAKDLQQLERELSGSLDQKTRRHKRLLFCRLLAVAYLLLTGHMPRKGGAPKIHKVKKFYDWCEEHVRNRNGAPYSGEALRLYVRYACSSDPEREFDLNQLRVKQYQRRAIG